MGRVPKQHWSLVITDAGECAKSVFTYPSRVVCVVARTLQFIRKCARMHIGVVGPAPPSLYLDEEPLQESDKQTHSSEIEGALDIGPTQTAWRSEGITMDHFYKTPKRRNNPILYDI